MVTIKTLCLNVLVNHNHFTFVYKDGLFQSETNQLLQQKITEYNKSIANIYCCLCSCHFLDDGVKNIILLNMKRFNQRDVKMKKHLQVLLMPAQQSEQSEWSRCIWHARWRKSRVCSSSGRSPCSRQSSWTTVRIHSVRKKAKKGVKNATNLTSLNVLSSVIYWLYRLHYDKDESQKSLIIRNE